jgi:hypothetical protein
VSTTPKPPAKSSKPKIIAITPSASGINPPEDWNIKHPLGFFMAADNTPAGRLVRLAEILRWLESSRSMPRKEALSVLCDAMPPEIMKWLYWVQAGDYANPVPADYMFGYKSAKNIAADKHEFLQCSTLNEFADHEWPEPTEPGFDALLKRLHSDWSRVKINNSSPVDILDHPRFDKLTKLSISLTKAAEIWGYGRTLTLVDSTPTTYAELADYRAKNNRAKWTSSMIEILRTEDIARQSQPQARKKIGEELGVSDRRIGQLLNEKRNTKTKQGPKLQNVWC